MNDDISEKGGGVGCGFLLALIIIWLIWGIGKSGKYQGQTAEEWYDSHSEVTAQLNYCKSKEPNEELKMFQVCIEQAEHSISELVPVNCKIGERQLTQQQCITLLARLGEVLEEDKRSCFEDYIN